LADKARLKAVGFDYVGLPRGHWACLRDGAGRNVTLCEWPASLLSMLKAGVLVGEAKEDAEALECELAKDPNRRDPTSTGRKAWTDWRRGQDAIHL
jgi:hypothetical protein